MQNRILRPYIVRVLSELLSEPDIVRVDCGTILVLDLILEVHELAALRVREASV